MAAPALLVVVAVLALQLSPLPPPPPPPPGENMVGECAWGIGESVLEGEGTCWGERPQQLLRASSLAQKSLRLRL